MKRVSSLLFPLVLCSSITLAQDVVEIGIPHLTEVVPVSVTTPWTPTGKSLNIGDTVNIMVSGLASTSGSVNPNRTYWIGPEGHGNDFKPDNPLPTVAGNSVIGRIGASGTPFYVGRNITIRANVSGELYLGYNDYIFWDNYGYYIAYIICKTCGGGTTAVDEPAGANHPDNAVLQQNYPNPFNPSTTIEYQMPSRGNVTLGIYNSLGQLVRTLINGEMKEPGSQSVIWDGRNDAGGPVSSGAYFYQIRVNDQVQAKRMLLLK